MNVKKWVMSDEWWVMSYEWWVMSDGNWVMEIEWWKMLNQTSPKFHASKISVDEVLYTPKFWSNKSCEILLILSSLNAFHTAIIAFYLVHFRIPSTMAYGIWKFFQHLIVPSPRVAPFSLFLEKKKKKKEKKSPY